MQRFLDDVEQEGQLIDDNTDINELLNDNEEKETPTDSLTETKPEKDSPSQLGDKDKSEEENDLSNTTDEKKTPFHLHPRFKEVTTLNRQLKEQNQELTERLNNLENKISSKEKETSEVADWFKDSISDDPNVWKSYVNATENQKREIIEAVKEEQNKIATQQEKQRQWVSDNLQTLRDDGKEFEENEFLNFMVKRKPTNEKGDIDFNIGYEWYKEHKLVQEYQEGQKKNKKIEAKKEIAKSTRPTPGKINNTPIKTISDLRHKSFETLAQED